MAAVWTDDDEPLPACDLRRKAAIIVAFILVFTAAAAACSVAFAPSLAASALLAYSFGLRHGIDADHIAAIDNVTRRLTTGGRKPATVGLFFCAGPLLRRDTHVRRRRGG